MSLTLTAMIRAALLVALATVSCSHAPAGGTDARGPADVILRGGRVFVGDDAGTVATSIALRGDRIVAAGSDAETARLGGEGTRVIDLRGRLVTAGMNDAHLHLAAGGMHLLEPNLRATTSVAQVEQLVREAAAQARPGDWITARGWDHTRMPASDLGPGGWPTKGALDRAAPANPVYLRRVDGHTGWVNTAALKAAGITAATPDPEGGEIVRDPATGEPTGILKENAKELVSTVVPAPSAARHRQAVLKALAECARLGVTSVQTSASPRDLDLLRALAASGELTTRVYAWLELDEANIARYRAEGVRAPRGDKWVRVGLLKGYADGTLGSRTAWMLEPFADDPSTRGIPTLQDPELTRLVLAADAAGLQLAIHAIGDGANRAVLDALEAARKANGSRDARHRIEHAQVLDAADLPRFAALGVVASMQPTHATSDMRWAEERIGHARAAEGAYAWRTLLQSGARVAFGTDFSVEPLAPVEGLYSAVTRQSRSEPGQPPGGWLPDQRLRIDEALRLYTRGSAYAEHQEREKGTLEPGLLADLVVWDRDLLSVAPEEILKATPALTITGGRVVYEAR